MHALPLIFLTAAVSVGAPGDVPPDPLEALLRDSPFLPATGTTRAPAAGEGGPLELRSVVFDRGKFYFSIYDQGSRESKWVTLDQQDLPFVLRSYNQEQDLVSVEYQGRTLALKLQTAHMAGQSPPSPGSPPPLPTAEEAVRPGGARPANSPPPHPSALPLPAALPPGESQRLQDMADEIRRRRQQPVQPSSP